MARHAAFHVQRRHGCRAGGGHRAVAGADARHLDAASPADSTSTAGEPSPASIFSSRARAVSGARVAGRADSGLRPAASGARLPWPRSTPCTPAWPRPRCGRWCAGRPAATAAGPRPPGCFLGLGLGNHLTTVWLLPAAGIVLWTASGSAAGSCEPAPPWRLAWRPGCWSTSICRWPPPAIPPSTGAIRAHWMACGGWCRASFTRVSSLAVAWSDVPGRLAGWSAELWRSFLPWGVAAALLGLATLLSAQPSPWPQPSAASLLLGLVWAIGYNTSDSLLSLLPGWVILALALGVGVAAALDWLAERSESTRSAGRRAAGHRPGCGAVDPALAGARTCAATKRPSSSTARCLQQAPADAVVLTAGDRATFALWYGRYGLGLRPDVTPVSRDLWALASYRATVASQHPDLAGAAPPADLARFAAGGRPAASPLPGAGRPGRPSTCRRRPPAPPCPATGRSWSCSGDWLGAVAAGSLMHPAGLWAATLVRRSPCGSGSV